MSRTVSYFQEKPTFSIRFEILHWLVPRHGLRPRTGIFVWNPLTNRVVIRRDFALLAEFSQQFLEPSLRTDPLVIHSSIIAMMESKYSLDGALDYDEAMRERERSLAAEDENDTDSVDSYAEEDDEEEDAS